jgi:hypothetical protein
LRPQSLAEPLKAARTRGYEQPCRLFYERVDVILRAHSWAVSSAVEHCFHTAGVTGSIPVPPTIQTHSIQTVTRYFSVSKEPVGENWEEGGFAPFAPTQQCQELQSRGSPSALRHSIAAQGSAPRTALEIGSSGSGTGSSPSVPIASNATSRWISPLERDRPAGCMGCGELNRRLLVNWQDRRNIGRVLAGYAGFKAATWGCRLSCTASGNASGNAL